MLNRVFAALSAALMKSAAMRLVPTEQTVSLGSRRKSKEHRVHKQSGKRLNRSHQTPHFGEKERERAPRFYMETRFPNGNPRSAPVMLQVSRKQYDAMVLAAETRAMDEAKWTSTAASYRAAQEEA